MNILGRIAYYFSYFWSWLIDTWEWLTNLINENILLRELIKILGIGLVILIFIALIQRVLDAISG